MEEEVEWLLMGNFLYHGKDEHQCYYEATCLVCFIKMDLEILHLWRNLRMERKKK